MILLSKAFFFIVPFLLGIGQYDGDINRGGGEFSPLSGIVDQGLASDDMAAQAAVDIIICENKDCTSILVQDDGWWTLIIKCGDEIHDSSGSGTWPGTLCGIGL